MFFLRVYNSKFNSADKLIFHHINYCFLTEYKYKKMTKLCSFYPMDFLCLFRMKK